MTLFNWKGLRELRPAVESLLELCEIASAPVDVESIASLIGVELVAVRPDQLADMLPWEVVEPRLPEVDELLIDGVVKIDDAKAIIFLSNASNIAPTRRRFTIATLLFYVIYEPPGTYVRMQGGPQMNLESDALDFASELLMPSSLLHRELADHPNVAEHELAQLFKVSPAAVKVRFGRLSDPAEEPWLALGISPQSSLEDAEKIVEGLLAQHRPELFESLPPEYGDLATRRRQELKSGLARLRLQHVLRLPEGIPYLANVPTVAEARAVLKDARKLIATRGWCRRFRATDGYGKKQIRFDRPNAGMFNPVGAIFRAAGDYEGARDIALAVFAKAAGVRAHPSEIDRWNEEAGRTLEVVLSTFDQAIALTDTDARPQ